MVRGGLGPVYHTTTKGEWDLSSLLNGPTERRVRKDPRGEKGLPDPQGPPLVSYHPELP